MKKVVRILIEFTFFLAIILSLSRFVPIKYTPYTIDDKECIANRNRVYHPACDGSSIPCEEMSFACGQFQRRLDWQFFVYPAIILIAIGRIIFIFLRSTTKSKGNKKK